MKLKASNSRKLRYGGVSAILTALIIAVIIIANIIFSALAQRFLWYTDLTPKLLFSLSEEFKTLLVEGDPDLEDNVSPFDMVDKDREARKEEDPDFEDEDLMIKIIFCDEKDVLEENLIQRYVYDTALELADTFGDYIEVETHNIVHNPSAVAKYKTTSKSTISTTSVIITYGGEFHVRELRSFFVFDTAESTEPWAYNGEKVFASSIMALTRAENPLACVITNHGESISTAFATTLQDAGYEVRNLNLREALSTDVGIPEACRLIIIHDPKEDFLTKDNALSDVDEILALKEFVENSGSLMVFISPDLTVKFGEDYALPELESWLDEEWGVSFDRYEDVDGGKKSYVISEEPAHSLGDRGKIFEAQYVTAGGAASITEDLRSSASTPPSVVFSNAMSISYSYDLAHYDPTNDENAKADAVEYDYGEYVSGANVRKIYDIFTTGNKAEAIVDGRSVAEANGNPFKLMTITEQKNNKPSPDGSYISDPSFVVACGSVDFASDDALTKSYGNTDVLLSLLKTLNKEPVPVGITYKAFADSTIDTLAEGVASKYTIALTVIPAVITLGVGIFVIVRRKYR